MFHPTYQHAEEFPFYFFNSLPFRNSLKSNINSNHCLISVAGNPAALTECRCVARLETGIMAKICYFQQTVIRHHLCQLIHLSAPSFGCHFLFPWWLYIFYQHIIIHCRYYSGAALNKNTTLKMYFDSQMKCSFSSFSLASAKWGPSTIKKPK